MSTLQYNEGLERNDLTRLVNTLITVDEYKSKMGDDEEIIVFTFQVASKEPANDLVSFIEKSYDWVIDADCSSGELDSGDYLVFVEADRRPSVLKKFILMLEDLKNLCGIELHKWVIKYSKSQAMASADLEKLKVIVPTTTKEYKNLHLKLESQLNSLRLRSGILINTMAPVNDRTESIRVRAGIK